MYKLDFIRMVHLEISSECNAACPQCPRNLYGYPYNDGYIARNLTLAEAEKIFQPSFVKQLDKLLINGNFGDIVMNLEAVEIIKYFRKHNTKPEFIIEICTNGGARNRTFWTQLAELQCHINFAIEGIDNTTHALYRQNTLYDTVIKNAQAFIQAGGHACWKMVQFEHNQSQVDQARTLSQQMGFKRFELIDHGRDTGPVYNTHGQVVHIMKEDVWKNMGLPTALEDMIDFRKSKTITNEHVNINIRPKINCEAIRGRSLYISSTGSVYPCCYLGMAPETYGHGCYMQPANQQIREIIEENSALEYGLEHAIQWFNSVPPSWDKPTVEQGRLILCNDNCGCG